MIQNKTSSPCVGNVIRSYIRGEKRVFRADSNRSDNTGMVAGSALRLRPGGGSAVANCSCDERADLHNGLD